MMSLHVEICVLEYVDVVPLLWGANNMTLFRAIQCGSYLKSITGQPEKLQSL